MVHCKDAAVASTLISIFDFPLFYKQMFPFSYGVSLRFFLLFLVVLREIGSCFFFMASRMGRWVGSGSANFFSHTTFNDIYFDPLSLLFPFSLLWYVCVCMCVCVCVCVCACIGYLH